jgi:hypothetical protein
MPAAVPPLPSEVPAVPDAPLADLPLEAAPPGVLDREVALIRDVIRGLHSATPLPADVLRQLAELRHQVATLCTLLRTCHTLATGARAARDAELDRLIEAALEDLDRADAERLAALEAGEVAR